MSNDSFHVKARGAWTGIKLLSLLTVGICDFFLSRPSTLRAQCETRQKWCARMLRALNITIAVTGELPQRGIVASNHLSYLDILTFGAIFGGVFVSKREVRSWPLIGLFTRLAGTIYVDRSDRTKSFLTANAMQAALAQDLPVMFFPEGTSSDGSHILRFRAALFQAAIDAEEPVFPASVSYRVAGIQTGVCASICYFGDMVFFPHLVRFLRLRDVSANIRFAKPIIESHDRFDLARQTQKRVGQLAEVPLAPETEQPTNAIQSSSTQVSELSLSEAPR